MNKRLLTVRILPASTLVGLWFSAFFYAPVCYGQFPGLKRTATPQRQETGLQNEGLQLDLSKDVSAQLLSFDDLYDMASQYSPLIRTQNEVATSLDAVYHSSKLEILNRVSGFANYSTGNQAIISSDAAVKSIGQIANGYRVGVNVQLSLYDLLGRPHQIKQARANYQVALLQKETIKFQIKRELISIYQDLITSQQVLKIRMQEEQSSLITFQVAEAEGQQGGKRPEEVSEAGSRYAQSKAAAEEARGAFIKNAYFLEALVGVPIQQLKRK